MAAYEYTERTTTVHEWSLPYAELGGHGVPVAELQKAIHAAEERYKQAYGADVKFYDDWLRAHAADDKIILSFVVE